VTLNRAYFNWPTAVFATGLALLLALSAKYTLLGPKGLDDKPTQAIGGVGFVFVSVHLLAATQSESLAWLARLCSRQRLEPRQNRVNIRLMAGALLVVGCVQLVRLALQLLH
jgi:hypothetical protein